MNLAAELEFALRLADLADALTLPFYEERAFTVDRKTDRSEVTEADRQAEALLRAAVAEAFPNHGFVGEEAGVSGDPT